MPNFQNKLSKTDTGDKKPYKQPNFQLYGSIRDLTQGTSSAAPDGKSSGNMMP